MKRTEIMIASATLALVAYTLTLSIAGVVLSSLQTSRTVPNTGAVKAIGVGVYWDRDCTNPLSSIDWGILEPGSSENVTCYIRNEGTSASTLSMYTSDWNPSNASEHISLNWDYGGQSVSPDEVVRVTFMLSISATIEGITSFSFNIIITASG